MDRFRKAIKPGCNMKTRTRSILFFSAVLTLAVLLVPLYGISQDKGGIPQDKRWVYFSYDKNEAGTEYYYDRETVSYTGQNRANVWMKIVSPGAEDFLQIEIECFGKMFRTITAPKSFFGTSDKKSYLGYGWLDIPPDSEIYLLSKIVCKPPAK
jgi:hypothetical protein